MSAQHFWKLAMNFILWRIFVPVAKNVPQTADFQSFWKCMRLDECPLWGCVTLRTSARTGLFSCWLQSALSNSIVLPKDRWGSSVWRSLVMLLFFVSIHRGWRWKEKRLLLATTPVSFAPVLWPNLVCLSATHTAKTRSEQLCAWERRELSASPAPAVEQLLPRGTLCSSCRGPHPIVVWRCSLWPQLWVLTSSLLSAALNHINLLLSNATLIRSFPTLYTVSTVFNFWLILSLRISFCGHR